MIWENVRALKVFDNVWNGETRDKIDKQIVFMIRPGAYVC